MSKPVVFLSTLSRSSKGALPSVEHLAEEIRAANAKSAIEPVLVTTPNAQTLLSELRRQRDDVTIFHFDGNTRHYQELLEVYSLTGTDSLPVFLKQLPQLRLVFLSYCSTPAYINDLQNAGIPVIVGTSRHAKRDQVDQFASIFYQHFLNVDIAIKDAYEQAAAISQIIPGEPRRTKPPFYAFLSGDKSLRRWWVIPAESQVIGTPAPHIIGNDSSLLNAASSSPSTPTNTPPLSSASILPVRPFPGFRAYKKEESLVFFGRDKERQQLYKLVATPAQPPIMLLHGQSGIGKTSLLVAGLWVDLEQEYQVIYVNGKVGNLFAALDKTAQRLPTLPLTNDFWTPLLEPHKKGVIVLVDQFEAIIPPKSKRQKNELACFMAALHLLLDNSPQTSHRKVLFCVRTEKLAVCQQWLLNHSFQPAAQEYVLFPLNRLSIEQVINPFTQLPVLQAEYQLGVDDNLATTIADDLLADAGSSIAPFLQAILLRLWQECQLPTAPAQQLSLKTYQHLRDQNELFSEFFDEQLQKMSQWPQPFFNRQLIMTVLAFHARQVKSGPSRTPAALQQEYRWRYSEVKRLTTQLKDLYLLTDTIQQNGNDTRLGNAWLDAPIQSGLYPQTRAFEWWWQIYAVFLALIHALRWLGRWLWHQFIQLFVIARQWTVNIGFAIGNEYRRRKLMIWQIIRVAVGLIVGLGIILVIFFVIARPLLRLGLNQNNLQPYLGDLQSSRLFLLSEKETPRSLWASLKEELAGVHPVRAGSDITFTQLKPLTLQTALPSVHRYSPVRSLAFRPNAKQLFFNRRSGFLYVWNLTTQRETALLLQNPKPIDRVACSPDGRFLLLAYTDGTAARVRLADQLPFEVEIPHKGAISSVSFSPDSTMMLTTGRDGAIHLYDTATTKLLFNGVRPHGSILAAALHPDNKMLAYADTDHNIFMLDWTENGMKGVLTGHTATINSLEFNQDGTHLLSASDDGTVRMWRSKEGTEAHKFEASTDPINIAHYSSDGNFVVATGADKMLRIWSAHNYLLLGTLGEYVAEVTSLVISPDSMVVASADENGNLLLWDMSIPTELVQ